MTGFYVVGGMMKFCEGTEGMRQKQQHGGLDAVLIWLWFLIAVTVEARWEEH